ncbi:LPXTG cell wall anchor domain-containing protein [Brochothrix thermosphacta]|uniref:LPXTG cell wall anchor domain-containing protein n=1 Tax=Brochothrix thermosphacta TaxID=2756 RepID=UPI0027140C58|nr:LPXTG cell wall anchor domain-containing protein [Brochothrix thermosphacta]MDO7864136.1 LPXTG cell wall anchor domain-containing protein [Brochothrix thermosphacta]
MNKRHRRGLISVISAVLIICTASFTGIDAKAATQVIIPDNALRTVIKDTLNLNDDTDITDESLLKLKELRAVNKNISSLEGLGYALNLGEMYLSENNISDLSPLLPIFNNWEASTGNYFFFDVSSNNISDLSMFNDVPKLPRYSVFHFENNQIRDFSPIAQYPAETFYASNPNNQTITLPTVTLTSPTFELDLPYVETGFPTINVNATKEGIYENGKVTWNNLTGNSEVRVTYTGSIYGPFEYSVTIIQPYTLLRDDGPTTSESTTSETNSTTDSTTTTEPSSTTRETTPPTSSTTTDSTTTTEPSSTTRETTPPTSSTTTDSTTTAEPSSTTRETTPPTPSTPTGSTSKDMTPPGASSTTDETSNQLGTITSNKNEVTNAKELPETGEKENKASTTLMGVLLIVLGIFSLVATRRKRLK